MRWAIGTIPLHAYVGAADGCGALDDAYGVHGCPPVNKHRLGKGGVVNRNEGLHSALRGKLNRRIEVGYSKTAGMLTLSLAPAWLKLGWLQHDCTCWGEYPRVHSLSSPAGRTRLHVLRIPPSRNHFQTYASFAILVWLWRRDFARLTRRLRLVVGRIQWI